MKSSITIIGAGNLGTALALGLSNLSDSPYTVTATRRNLKPIQHLKDKGIAITSDNTAATAQADIIILAVQPGQLEGVLQDIAPSLDADRHVMASAITGVSVQEISDQIKGSVPVLRVMPNTAAAINQSMTCIAASDHEAALEQATTLFEHLGRTLVIEESLMQASTVLNACGIAFFLRYIRAASQGGIEVGFHAEEAQLIAAQTALGASALLLESEGHPEQEIDKVTTPMGCTIAGLNEMEHNGLSSALIKGIRTSYEKIANIK